MGRDAHRTRPLPQLRTVGGGVMNEPLPVGEPLSEEEVAALREGTPVIVIWSGGNGPHRYVIAADRHGGCFAWDGETERLRFYNPLRFVGGEKYHTRVWLTRMTPDLDVVPGDPMTAPELTEADADDDGVDWAAVAWDDREMRGEAKCCDSRDHSNGTDDDVQCACPNHPRSYLHPAGELEWPAP